MATQATRGFDEVFVEPLSERLTCPICHVAFREPVLTRCGHHFCNSCLTPCLQQSASCPVCRMELKASNIFPNNAMKREILDLTIKCCLHEKGCAWTGELRNGETHDRECQFVDVVCENECEQLIMRKDEEDHVANHCLYRMVSCQHCDLKMKQLVIDDHYKECDQYPIDCTYKCGMMVQRCKMEDHIGRQGTCPNSLLDCDFEDNGCQFRGNRHDLCKHIENNIGLHFSLIASALKETNKKSAASEHQLKLEMNNTKEELRATRDELAETRDELAETRDELAETRDELAETRDELAETRNKLAETRDELAETRNELADLGPIASELKETKQKLSATEHELAVTRDELKNNRGNLMDTTMKLSLVHIPQTQNQFLFTWRIDHWHYQVKLPKVSKYVMPHIRSSQFCVYPGYHMYISAYPNGYDALSENYLSVFLFAVEGELDKKIKWPFPFSFDFELVDQQCGENNIRRQRSPPYGEALASSSCGNGCGFPIFASHEQLQSRFFIKDGSICIKLWVYVKNEDNHLTETFLNTFRC
ncbi:TNF receptor-associated factor 5-like [Corticium candelabrum]|uniref:TNF receptor-associated factor 5-like n=1 Tax=Corticium candelabrum TaxID=121492 RepID=UPI002E273301|nr:TNF receptor-associated factor 5-like [Corticium candelabrum]